MAVSCVRADPRLVEFNDIKIGHVYKKTVTLFQFTAASPAMVVVPGLLIPEKQEEVRDCLLIHVEDTETIKIPLLEFPKVCSLLVDSVLDFGCIAANNQVISKHHPITNKGTAPGAFQVQYSRDPLVTVSPCVESLQLAPPSG
uniref:cilia- and flagella-associated protein 47 isoform X3 n=1 Tax=Monopterus albus TaxID=43700 RepID=UPI0009B38EC6|nr:cilia- and flagella-associated protein 47 isoform X3 [Monopterus albus]